MLRLHKQCVAHHFLFALHCDRLVSTWSERIVSANAKGHLQGRLQCGRHRSGGNYREEAADPWRERWERTDPGEHCTPYTNRVVNRRLTRLRLTDSQYLASAVLGEPLDCDIGVVSVSFYLHAG